MAEKAEQSYCLYGTGVLGKRLRALGRLGGRARKAEDMEAIHKTRVASRRLRTALALFGECLPSRKVRRWQKSVRRLTRALGAARDSDVQIAFVEGFLNSVDRRTCRPGIERLLLRLKQRRARLQEDVIQTLDRLDRKDMAGEMTVALSTRRARARTDSKTTNPLLTLDGAGRRIGEQLRTLLGYEPYVTQPECVEELHRMRIAAKHLRYTLEAFAPLYAGRLKEAIRATIHTQDLLGALHDCDVWLVSLPACLQEEKTRTVGFFGHDGPFKEIIPGIERLQQDRQEARAAIHKRFVRFWRKTHRRRVWRDLTCLIAPQRASAIPRLEGERA